MATTRLQSGVEHITDRLLNDLEEFEVLGQAARDIKIIFDSKYTVSKNLHNTFGLRTVNCYLSPELVLAPADTDIHEYATVLGKTAIAERYVICYTTVDEAMSTRSGESTAYAMSRIKSGYKAAGHSSVILFEEAPSPDSETLSRIQQLRGLIAELDAPSAVVIR